MNFLVPLTRDKRQEIFFKNFFLLKYISNQLRKRTRDGEVSQSHTCPSRKQRMISTRSTPTVTKKKNQTQKYVVTNVFSQKSREQEIHDRKIEMKAQDLIGQETLCTSSTQQVFMIRMMKFLKGKSSYLVSANQGLLLP